MKTDDITRKWAHMVANYALIFVGIFMALVSITMPFLNPLIKNLWFSLPNFYYLLPIPLITLLLFILLMVYIKRAQCDYRPFLLTIGIFLMGYIGLGISLYPWIVPFHYTLQEAAAYGPSLSLMLVGVLPLLPIIIGYTAYCYYIFRGKTG
jgi:cytochrome d ubiquinol oxidase subunit II